MLFFSNKQVKFAPQQCTQCGVCLAACANNALDITPNQNTGLFSLAINSHCTQCGECVAACPARRIPHSSLPLFPQPRAVLLSHSTNASLRHSASSGGAVRSLAAAALHKGLAAEAYLVVRDATYPWAKGAVCHTAESVLEQAANSMYLPVPIGQNLHLAKGGTSIVLVGLPCQLAGGSTLLKKRYDQVYTICLFCKQQKHLGATCHMARRLKQTFSPQGSALQYRGQGWPGMVSLNQASIPYEREGALTFRRRLWRIPACRFCDMPFGKDVDITVADPWNIDTAGPGRSMVMVWTTQGEALVQAAEKTLAHELITNMDLVQHSVDMPGIQQKALLAHWYAQKHVPFLVRAAGMAETVHIRLLEWLLETIPLPEIGYRALGKLPAPANNILRLQQYFEQIRGKN